MHGSFRSGLVGVVLASAGSVFAQPLPVELSYSNPGARSMGFGGAFVALADDATAAFANPAGLVQLTRPEISIEGRSWSYSTPYTAGGRARGAPSGIGIDTDPGLRIGESTADLTGLSFLSFVHPRKRWTLAAYRHELLNFELETRLNGLFADPPAREGLDYGFAGVVRDQDTPVFLDSHIVSYSFAAAFRANDALSFGFGLSWADGDMHVVTQDYLPDDDSMASYFAPGSFLPERLEQSDTATVDDVALTLSAGFLLKLGERWQLGGSYRTGPEFELDVATRSGPADPFGGSADLRATVDVPDVFALGIAFRDRGGRLTAAFEWDRVDYSTLLENLGAAAGIRQLEQDDADELHVGAEYAFLGTRPVLALRLGSWLDPDHRARYAGDLPFPRALFRGGDDDLHLALGVGVAFARFQVDLAADFSDLRDTVSISMIYAF